ncbi:PspC domain-containing protein [Streptomyces sp. OF3]|uniref:PspC domain-containing protein n=1 Tax=Streptomyces alkaliterrae TaxID=2213162 RepID=A0A7W3WIB8_9ACTN|nr:PspC domain-containing protein [Streptomyces alkaliterrae]MBB1252854.1 PspC domain-containing protein [Streptomyces alkaliterrae]
MTEQRWGAGAGAGGPVGGGARRSTAGAGGADDVTGGTGADGADGTRGDGGVGGSDSGAGGGWGPHQPPPGRAHGRLERSRRHKVVGGVCGGLGRHFDVDPIIFRVPVAALAVLSGLGLLFYGFAWLFMPMEDEDENEVRRLLSGRVELSSLAAVLCALAGTGLVLASLDNSRVLTFGVLVGAAVGAAAYWSQNRRTDAEEGAESRPQAPPEAQAPPAPAGPSWWREPQTADSYLWGPEEMDGGAADELWRPPEGRPAPPVEKAPPRPASLGGLVFTGALAAAVAGGALAWPTQPLGTALVIAFGCALAVFGLGLLISAFIGRLGGGTIVNVVLTGVLLVGAAALPSDITTNWGERFWRPATAAELRTDYRIGTGRGVLDLSGLELEDDQTVRTSVRVAAGELEVIVPKDALVEVDLSVGLGGYQLPQATTGSGDGSVHGGGFRVTEKYSIAPSGRGDPKGTIELRLDLGLGGANVVREGETAWEGSRP